MKINLIGGIFGTSGYASHTRQLANAMFKLNPDIHLDIQVPQGWEREVNENEKKMILNPYYNDGVNLAVMLPNQWQPLLSNPCSEFWGYCVWEGSHVPKFWLDIFNDERVKKIIVPSKHTLDAIVNTLNDLSEDNMKEVTDKTISIINKIKVVSHGVDLELFKPMPKKFNDGKFRFIMNKGWASGLEDRGGVQWGIKAFNEEFSKDEPVELMVKINTAYCGPAWNLGNEISKLGLRPDGGIINFNLENLSFDKIPDFYSMGDVFLSPNMSESFGLPMAEAMACGLPVITTDFGGMTEFVNSDNGWLVKTKLVEVDWDLSYEGVCWGMPDLSELRKTLREVYNDKELVKKKGERALNDIQGFSWDTTAKLILEK